MSMIIRSWTKKDIDKIAQIEAFSFSDPWTKENLSDVLRFPYYKSFLAEEWGQVCGYGCMIVMYETAEIANIAVAAPFRGRGLGKAILERMHFVAKTLGVEQCLLEVRPSNLSAIGLYQKCGYTTYGVRERYYGNEDALLMSKQL